jgi:hypothetical protein
VSRFTDRYPTLNDPAGSNARDPQARTLTVTVRGGVKRFYLFRVVPTVAVTMKMETTIAKFFADAFIANLATLLKISSDRIKIADVRSGSVIVDFTIDPANSIAVNDSSVTSQVGV